MKKSIFKKIISVTGKVFIWIFVIISVLFIILSLSQKQNNGFSNLFGYSTLSVQSNSMDGDKQDNFKQGDLIFVKALKQDKISELKVDDIIVFWDLIGGTRELNAHRIVEIIPDGSRRSFITKGDNNSTVDPFDRVQEDVVAVFTGPVISGGGKVLDFLNNQWGFFFCIVLPLILFFIWRIYKVIVIFMAYKKVDKDNPVSVDSEGNPVTTDNVAKLLADANVDQSAIEEILAKLKQEKETSETKIAAASDNIENN